MFREDFDDVIRLECGGRTLAALAGDLATQLNLRLEGDLESNLARLRSHCSARRYLLWLEGASADEADRLATGRGSSTLVSTERRPEAPPDDESLRDIQHIFNHPGMVDDWAELCRLARAGLRSAAEQGRVAESFELLGKWHALAEARGDRRILEESAREMVWILEGWDRLEEGAQYGVPSSHAIRRSDGAPDSRDGASGVATGVGYRGGPGGRGAGTHPHTAAGAVQSVLNPRLARKHSHSIDEAVADGEAYQFVDAVHVQFLHDAAAVRVDGIDAQVQGAGDLFVGFALGQHLEHFALAAAQQVDGIGDMLPIIVQHGIGDGWTEVAFAGRNGAHCGHEVVRHGILQ